MPVYAGILELIIGIAAMAVGLVLAIFWATWGVVAAVLLWLVGLTGVDNWIAARGHRS